MAPHWEGLGPRPLLELKARLQFYCFVIKVFSNEQKVKQYDYFKIKIRLLCKAYNILLGSASICTEKVPDTEISTGWAAQPGLI